MIITIFFLYRPFRTQARKEKNKKVNLGGKRRQENLRRIADKNLYTIYQEGWGVIH